MIRFSTKSWYIAIHFDLVGFGIAKLTGNNSKRNLYFAGIATIEAIDKREYPNIERATYTWNIFGKGKDGWIKL